MHFSTQNLTSEQAGLLGHVQLTPVHTLPGHGEAQQVADVLLGLAGLGRLGLLAFLPSLLKLELPITRGEGIGRSGEVILVLGTALQRVLPSGSSLKIVNSKLLLSLPFTNIGLHIVMYLIGRLNVHQEAQEGWNVNLSLESLQSLGAPVFKVIPWFLLSEDLLDLLLLLGFLLLVLIVVLLVLLLRDHGWLLRNHRVPEPSWGDYSCCSLAIGCGPGVPIGPGLGRGGSVRCYLPCPGYIGLSASPDRGIATRARVLGPHRARSILPLRTGEGWECS